MAHGTAAEASNAKRGILWLSLVGLLWWTYKQKPSRKRPTGTSRISATPTRGLPPPLVCYYCSQNLISGPPSPYIQIHHPCLKPSTRYCIERVTRCSSHVLPTAKPPLLSLLPARIPSRSGCVEISTSRLEASGSCLSTRKAFVNISSVSLVRPNRSGLLSGSSTISLLVSWTRPATSICIPPIPPLWLPSKSAYLGWKGRQGGTCS